MKIVTTHDAKSQLSKLLQAVEEGEEVVITRAGKPVAKLVKFSEPYDLSWIGKDAGRVWMADDFTAPLKEFEDEFYK